MKLKNKKTGENYEATMPIVFNIKTSGGGEHTVSCKSIKELNEKWEDYEELKEYPYILPNKVRRAILSWVRVQDNPIKKISILRVSYFDTKEVDADGFYDYEFFGYVDDCNKNLVANTMTIRLKKPFKFEENKDYTLPELGIMDEFGGEE